MDNRAGIVSDTRRFGLARRAAGYAASAIAASLIYIVWTAVWTAFGGAEPRVGLTFGFGFAFAFWLINGFALALLLMILPWAIAVWAHLDTRWDGRLYFPAVGAALVFILGCAASSISPKPLWIEDQTFLEGAVITAQRQGLCLVVSGIAFGACYWWLDRRNRPAL
jgi:hypothetical protein